MLDGKPNPNPDPFPLPFSFNLSLYPYPLPLPLPVPLPLPFTLYPVPFILTLYLYPLPLPLPLPAPNPKGGSTMKEAFKRLDVNNSGTIEKEELAAILAGFKVAFVPTDVDAMITKFDTNGDGRFSYGEFVKFMQAG
jgi:hypothetical protein